VVRSTDECEDCVAAPAASGCALPQDHPGIVASGAFEYGARCVGINRPDREGILLADTATNKCIRDNLPDEVSGCYEALRAFGCSSSCRACDATTGPVYRPAVCSTVCANIKTSCPLVWEVCDLASVYLPQCSDAVEEAAGTQCAPFIPWVGTYLPASVPAPATPITPPPTTPQPTTIPTPRPTFDVGTLSPTLAPSPRPTATPPPPPTPAVSFDYAAGIDVEAESSLELNLDIIPPVDAAPMPFRVARGSNDVWPRCLPTCTPAVTVDGVVRLNGGPLTITLDHRPDEGDLVPLLHSTVGYSGINGAFGSFKVVVVDEADTPGELHTRIVAVTQPARNGTLYAVLSTTQVGFNLGSTSTDGGSVALTGADLADAASRASSAGSSVAIVLPDTTDGDEGVLLSVSGDLNLGDTPLSLTLGSSSKTRDTFAPATLAVDGNVTLSGPVEVTTSLDPGDCRADPDISCNTTLLTVTATGEIDGTFSSVVVEGLADDGAYCTQYEGSTTSDGSSRLDVVLLQRTFGPTDCLVDRALCKCLFGDDSGSSASSVALSSAVAVSAAFASAVTSSASFMP